MKIDTYTIHSYKIVPPVGKKPAWAAKCTIYISKKEIGIGKFQGQTKEEVIEKAINALNRVLNS